jgi:hypothetical protein
VQLKVNIHNTYSPRIIIIILLHLHLLLELTNFSAVASPCLDPWICLFSDDHESPLGLLYKTELLLVS